MANVSFLIFQLRPSRWTSPCPSPPTAKCASYPAQWNLWHQNRTWSYLGLSGKLTTQQQQTTTINNNYCCTHSGNTVELSTLETLVLENSADPNLYDAHLSANLSHEEIVNLARPLVPKAEAYNASEEEQQVIVQRKSLNNSITNVTTI